MVVKNKINNDWSRYENKWDEVGVVKWYPNMKKFLMK